MNLHPGDFALAAVDLLLIDDPVDGEAKRVAMPARTVGNRKLRMAELLALLNPEVGGVDHMHQQ